MPLKISNNATSLLSSSITTSNLTVSITGGDEGKFPSLGVDEWCPIVVTRSTGEREIMKCTARSGVNLTVVRGQEGTTPLVFDAGQARVDVRLTAAAIQEIAIHDYIYSIPADMSAGFRVSSNRFAWYNNKVFGSGTEIATLSDLGNFTTNGTATIKGLFTASASMNVTGTITATSTIKGNGYFIGGSLVLLAPTTAGTIYMRPNGSGETAQQTTLGKDGHLRIAGDVFCNDYRGSGSVFASHFYSTQASLILSAVDGNIYFRPKGTAAGSGRVNETYIAGATGDLVCAGQITADSIFQSTDTTCIIAAKSGGTIELRPNGAASTAERTYINTSGDVICGLGLYAGNSTTGGNANDGLFPGKGIREKAGSSANYGTNFMNLLYNQANDTRIYTDNTHTATAPAPCDYRIKQKFEPLGRTWDMVKRLRPLSFQYRNLGAYKDDGVRHWGFIAHELQEDADMALATGRKDQDVEANGYQSPDHMAVIAALTNTLQEAMVRIEALEEQLASHQAGHP